MDSTNLYSFWPSDFYLYRSQFQETAGETKEESEEIDGVFSSGYDNLAEINNPVETEGYDDLEEIKAPLETEGYDDLEEIKAPLETEGYDDLEEQDVPSVNTGYDNFEELNTPYSIGQPNKESVRVESLQSRVLHEKTTLLKGGITFDLKPLQLLETSLVDKANQMGRHMPKLSPDQRKTMAAFIEVNRDSLLAFARDGDDGLYIRREVSGLPLSLFVSQEGKFIWELKRKAVDQLPMGGAFKKVYTCLDHDRGESLISATMAVDQGVRGRAAAREIKAAKALRGLKNVAEVVSASIYLSKPGRELKNKVRVVMRLYSGGDLRKLILKKRLSDDQKDKNIGEILEGLVQIHSLGWVHGDCKPDNIFFDEEGIPYLGDFGAAHEKNILQTAGQVTYRHPMFLFVLKRGLSNAVQGNLQEKQDLYSLGLTLAQMELGLPKLPWDNPEINHRIGESARFANDENASSSDILEKGMEITFKIAEAFEKFYRDFPKDTLRQKFILKLLDPNIDNIPSAQEAKEMWEGLYTPSS